MYIVKNVSTNNIVIDNQFVRPNQEIKLFELDKVKAVMQLGYVSVRNAKSDVSYPIDDKTKSHELIANTETILKNTVAQNQVLMAKHVENKKDEIDTTNIKSKLTNTFFSYYLDKKLSDEELKLVKYFYRNIGFTNKVSSSTLNLIDQADNQEDLTAVLLNNVYPELFDLFVSNKK